MHVNLDHFWSVFGSDVVMHVNLDQLWSVFVCGVSGFFWCFRNISVGNDVGCRIAMPFNPSVSPFKF